MNAVAIVGAQWGDEGKGKIVDLLAANADAVVRYAGGPNAGHTLVIGGAKMVFRLVPSGILQEHTRCILGQGMVLDPAVLIQELDALSSRGVSTRARILVSEMAHLILPYHVHIDELRESSKTSTHIGTTKRGIGPCYEDKIGRRGLRAGVLRDLDRARQHIGEALRSWTPVIQALGGDVPTIDDTHAWLAERAARIVPLLGDAAEAVDTMLTAGRRVMFEGAQGTMLDIDHGTYPYVTSSSAVAGGACIGAGVGPTRMGRVIGISKAYSTRVGAGPFPTELHDAVGEHLRSRGGEFGSVTGRPRRTGWLDLPQLRYARRVNGLDGLVVTKLDVLTGLDEIRVCIAYDTPRGRTEVFPVSNLADATPVFATRAGWKEDISACRSVTDLPATARKYLELISTETKLPLYLVSVGPERDATMVLADVFGGDTRTDH